MVQYTSLEERILAYEASLRDIFENLSEIMHQEAFKEYSRLLELIREKHILELATLRRSSTSDFELERLQGKIEVIGSILRTVQLSLGGGEDDEEVPGLRERKSRRTDRKVQRKVRKTRNKRLNGTAATPL